MPAQYPGIGFPPDGPVPLARKLVNNTALMAAGFPSGTIPSFGPVPSGSGSPGAAGDMAEDGSYLYVYSATAGAWRRTPIDDWV